MNIRYAEMFARGAHAGQIHRDKPFFGHLKDVVYELTNFGFDIEEDELMMCSAYLHHILEDTPVTYQYIEDLFGKDTADLVWTVTDEMGRNRKERRERAYPKIFSTRESSILKLADLSANVHDSIKNQTPQLEMYREEWESIYAAFTPGLMRQAPDILYHFYDLDRIVRKVGE